MQTKALEKHIFDTVKEWQMKIGYREEDMRLYYPAESLCTLLGLDKGDTNRTLYEALEAFGEEEKEKLGALTFSNIGERYCIEVPKEGCTYIHEKVQEFAFLKLFLVAITTAGNTIKEVERVFSDYANEHETIYRMQDKREEGLGVVFYFEDARIDDAVYCVEEDGFGLTYHRFMREDYQKIIQDSVMDDD